jgi:hypothetical protein
MPEGIEQCGITDGLDPTTLQRLQNGFADIRAYQGWENFKIPSYFWDYVDQTSRDNILIAISKHIYDARGALTIQHDLWFAYSYTLALFSVWLMNAPTRKKPIGYDVFEILVADIGMPIKRPTAKAGVTKTLAEIEADGNIDFSHAYIYCNPPGTDARYSISGGYLDYYGTGYYTYARTRFYFETGTRYDYFDFSCGISPDIDCFTYDYLYPSAETPSITATLDGSPADWGGTYAFQDYWWTNYFSYYLQKDGPLTTLEKYGATYELDETYQNYLVQGFDRLRQREGWENFHIPEKVWTYIGQEERDRILDFLYNRLYVARALGDYAYLCEPISIELLHEIFAFRYAMFLFQEYFRDNLNEQYQYYGKNRSFFYEELLGSWKLFLTMENLSTSWVYTEHPYYEFGFVFLEPYAGPHDSLYNWFCSWDLFYEVQDSASMSAEDPLYYYSYMILGHYLSCPSTIAKQTAKLEVDVNTDINNPDWNVMYDYLYSFYIDGTTYPDNWNDRGIEEAWPALLKTIKNGFFVNDDIPVLDGGITYRTFGAMEGSVSLATAISEGAEITIKWFQDNEEQYTVATGVVTSRSYDVATDSYTVYFADPITAGGGQAIYSTGYAIYALRDAIQYYGGSVEIDNALIPIEEFPSSASSPDSSWLSENITVYYNEDEDPPDFWQFARNVCYGLNAVLRYGRDGKYYIDALPSSHTLTPDVVISDDSPNIIDKPQDYANKVVATLDDTYYTVATDYTYDYYSAGGATVSIKKLGERLEWVKTDLGDGEAEERYYYDANGYLTRKVEEYEDGSTKHYKETVWKNIQDENRYDVEIVTRVWAHESWWEGGSLHTGWIEQNKTEVTWNVNLLGSSKFEKIQYSVDPPTGSKMNTTGESGEHVAYEIGFAEEDWHDWPYLWPKEKWKGTMVTNPEADFLNGFSVAEHFTYGVVGLYLPMGSSFPAAKLGWRKAYDGSTGGISTPPALEKYEAEDSHEVHLRAEAVDQKSIDFLGKFSYETTAIALNSEEGIKNFALNVLREKARVRHATASTYLNTGFSPHDNINWLGQDWHIDAIVVDLSNCCEAIELSGVSSLLRLKGSLPKEPITVLDDLKNVISKKTGQYHNIARGKIVARRGKNRYTVKVDNKAEEVVAKSIDPFPKAINSTVVLARPTGKRNKWFILGYSNEEEIQIQTTSENITPEIDASFGIGGFMASSYYTDVLETITLSWEYVFDTSSVADYGVTIDLGDGSAPLNISGGVNSTEVRFGTIGEMTPTISLWVTYEGETVTSEAMPLNRPIQVVAPSWENLLTVPDAITKDKEYLLEIQTDERVPEFFPDFLVGVNHGDGTGDQEGYFYFTVDGNGYHSYAHTWTSIPSEIDVTAKVSFTQADGTVYESVVFQKKYYNFPVGGELNYSCSIVVREGSEFIAAPYYGTLLREINGNTIGYGGQLVNWDISFKIAAGSSYGALNDLMAGDATNLFLHSHRKYRTTGQQTDYPDYGFDEAMLNVLILAREEGGISLSVNVLRTETGSRGFFGNGTGRGKLIIPTTPSSLAPITIKLVQTAGEYLKVYVDDVLTVDFTKTSEWDGDYKRIYPWLAWHDTITNPVPKDWCVRNFYMLSGLKGTTYLDSEKGVRRYKTYVMLEDGSRHYCGFVGPYDIVFNVYPTLVREDYVVPDNLYGGVGEFSYTKPY